MHYFKTVSDQFRLNEPGTYDRNLRGATIADGEDQYLFLLCAYDYVKNPADRKLQGMQTLFFTDQPDAPGVRFEAEIISWFLNIGEDYHAKIRLLLGTQTVMVSLEGKNAIPSLFAGQKSPATGNASFAASLQITGGVRVGGAANYNLFTKAIDVACSGFINGMNKTLADGIVKDRDKTLSGSHKQRLVQRYNTLRAYYEEQTLLGFGLTHRA